MVLGLGVIPEIGGLSLERARIMGILNITSDSFSDGGQFLSADAAMLQASRMLEEGADIIDIGGESTRPGAEQVSEQEELDRVIPVLQRVVSELGARVSVDTSKPQVMREAVAGGAVMINDVRALTEPGALEVATEAAIANGTAVCVMHMQGNPQNMQENPHYTHVVDEVKAFLLQRCEAAMQAGIAQNRLVIDPGFGFGKTTQHNLTLLNHLDRFCDGGFAVLAGLSRKRMFAEILAQDGRSNYQGSRLHASVAAAQIAATRGARVIRVHDVAPTAQALKVLERTENARLVD